MPPFSPSISESGFGTTRQGEKTALFMLVNENGLTAHITNYGGILTSLLVPDRAGVFENVVLGHESLQHYEADSRYFGAVVGRYANRIARGRFELDGKRYELAANNGVNHLHGGISGFDRAVWQASTGIGREGPWLLLSRVSPDGEEGYPGALAVKVRYTLNDGNSLLIEYQAETDHATPLNLTHHSYFNLAGPSSRSVLDHCLQIDAHYFTAIDEEQIPTGELRPVAGTPFDFRKMKAVGHDLGAENEQLANGGGYDHNFVVNRRAGEKLNRVARLWEEKSGRLMVTHSDQPGVQLYTGNYLTESPLKDDIKDRQALCLETQHFPDSPNQPGFPNTILRPGEIFRRSTRYSFSVET